MNTFRVDFSDILKASEYDAANTSGSSPQKNIYSDHKKKCPKQQSIHICRHFVPSPAYDARAVQKARRTYRGRPLSAGGTISARFASVQLSTATPGHAANTGSTLHPITVESPLDSLQRPPSTFHWRGTVWDTQVRCQPCGTVLILYSNVVLPIVQPLCQKLYDDYPSL